MVLLTYLLGDGLVNNGKYFWITVPVNNFVAPTMHAVTKITHITHICKYI